MKSSRSRLSTIILALVASLVSGGCDDSDLIKSPTEPTPPGTVLSGYWDVEVVSETGESHSGVLFLEQVEGVADGEISWHDYEQPLGLNGRVRELDWTFRATWGGWDCHWTGHDGRAEIDRSAQALRGELRLNWPCQDEEIEEWSLVALRR